MQKVNLQINKMFNHEYASAHKDKVLWCLHIAVCITMVRCCLLIHVAAHLGRPTSR